MRIRVLTTQKRKYAKLQIGIDCALKRPISSHFAAMGTTVSATNNPAPNDDAARVELHGTVGGDRPLKAGLEHREDEQQIGCGEPNLQGTARDVRQGRRSMEGFRLCCDRSVDRRIEMMRKPSDRRMHVDIAHRHVRHARILTNCRTDARHQQRVSTEIIKEVGLGRDMLGANDPGRARHATCARGRFSVGHTSAWR